MMNPSASNHRLNSPVPLKACLVLLPCLAVVGASAPALGARVGPFNDRMVGSNGTGPISRGIGGDRTPAIWRGVVHSGKVSDVGESSQDRTPTAGETTSGNPESGRNDDGDVTLLDDASDAPLAPPAHLTATMLGGLDAADVGWTAAPGAS